MGDEKPMEGVKTESNDYSNLKMVGQNASVGQFSIKMHISLSKIMEAYCEQQVDMEDEDTIMGSRI
ncbi:small ubiquitin-related modifier 2-like isoform X2 [Panthera tigris]|uniref:small ubiquitin-related modifier 2-like isoform X2 n=1 Tax=Panthera tigris TaxID=9694 RepID=UPI001C6F7CBB|nr:small ubiquitin-related modifier 2-like isoform X2 [Panthera tigris]